MNDVVLGTAYYPDYYPETDWARDLGRMSETGISCVRILEFAWCWYQPRPDSFEWDPLDRFLELCQERQLQVCLSTPTATPPPWFFQKYPDARLINIDGQPCFAHRHMTSWNHPGANTEAMRTIEALARRYGNHPAVWGWQIDNEPNYAEDPRAYYDFNPHHLAAGREWLKEKYGSLDALNNAWFACFWSQAVNEWEQVWTTHRPTVNPQSALDFLRWRDASMARFVQQQAGLLRQHTNAQKIGVNIPETGLPFSVTIGQDYWAQSAGMDWVGTDLYAASHDQEADMACFRQNCDIMRCVAEAARPGGAEFVMAECQGGPHLRAWYGKFACEAWRPDYLRRSSKVFAERGARHIWYFMWRPTPAGQEMGMNGVQTLEGENTSSTETICDLATPQQQEKLGNLRRTYAARPRAVVHYSRDTLLFVDHFKALDTVGKSLGGIHRQLDAQAFRIDYLTDTDLNEGRFPDARVLVLAESMVMSQEAQKHALSWLQADPQRELHVGMHTALLDHHGHFIDPSKRCLWNKLGVKPGLLHDQQVSVTVDGIKMDAFRAFEIPASTQADIKATLRWREQEYPARIRLKNQAVVYAYRWGLGTSFSGKHSLPFADSIDGQE